MWKFNHKINILKMSKFIELSFNDDTKRKTLVNTEKIENVFTDLEGIVHVTFLDGKVVVSESYETVKNLINN